MARIQDIIDTHAGQSPDAPAILQSGRPALTFQQLHRQIGSIAAALHSAGVNPAERVVIVLPEGAELAVAVLGTMAAAACAPLNPAYRSGEFETWFRTMRARAVIVSDGDQGPAVAAAERVGMLVIDLRSYPTQPAGVFTLHGRSTADQNHAPDASQMAKPQADTALLLFTSATSARPKLVPLTHNNLRASAQNICAATGLTAADRCLGVMPLFHIHGLSTLFATLLAGGSYVSASTFSVERFFASMEQFRPTWYSASPAIHRAIVDHLHREPAAGRSHSLRFARSASAAMPRQLSIDVERTLGVPLLEAYGMTEAAPQITSNRLPPAVRKPGSVGQPAGPEVAIIGKDGDLLPAGKTGEIVIRGENIMSGYECDPAANSVAFVTGWLRTGDLGYLDTDGHLFVTGRLKEVINRGGEKISPGVIEEVLLQHPAVGQAVVFGVPDAELGETIAAAVVLKAAAGNSSTAAAATGAWRDDAARNIRLFVAARLTHFEVPRKIVIVDQIPLGPTGKLKRSELAKTLNLLDNDQPSGNEKAVASPPRTAAERRVAEMFAQVLGRGPVGPQDDFFELGGNSLSAMRLAVQLRRTFGVELSVESLFEKPTVADVAGLLGTLMANLVAEGSASLQRPGTLDLPSLKSDSAIPRRFESGPALLSFTQRQAFFADQIGAGNSQNIVAPLWLDGPLDPDVLCRCLDEICRRHETLRSTFRLAGSDAIQTVQPPSPQPLRRIDIEPVPISQRAAEALRLANEEADRPFDLNRGPPFRAVLIRLGDEQHLLVLCIHHIACDGWSVGVLHRELAALYPALCKGGPSPLSPLQIQYADFAAWQHQRLADETLARQIQYWRDRLNDVAATCTFPTDRPRPAVQSYHGGTVQSLIDQRTTDPLQAMARKHDASLFMVCLAGFAALLHRHNGQDDCVIGTPIANRTRPELEPLIGFFANTLALRTDLSGDPAFHELLGRVRETALGAFANQEVPIERIVQELHVARDPGRTPLFQVMFAFQNLPASTDGKQSPARPSLPVGEATPRQYQLVANVSARPFALDPRGAKFDLTLYLTESPEGLRATWLFNADLFDRSTVERFAHRFQMLLEAIASGNDWPLAEFPILPESERRLVMEEWNRTDTQREFDRDFLQLFESQVANTPSATAIVCGDEHLTYADLNSQANQTGRFLERSGLATGSLVGVALGRSARAAVTMLGIWKAGGAVLPIDPAYPADGVAFMLADSRAGLLLTEAGLSPAPKALRVICLDAAKSEIDRESSDDRKCPLAADDLAYVIYTSGSSGQPKGVAITRANLCHYAQSMSQALGIGPNDRYLHTASFGFSSSMRQLTVPLLSGAAVVIASTAETRDPELLFDGIRRDRVSVIDIIPSFWAGCVQVIAASEPAARARFRRNDLRLIVSASEPLPSALIREWKRLLDHPAAMMNLYGQTETTGIVTTYRIPADAADLDRPIVPIGKPIANTRAFVFDAGLRPVPIGVWGELYIGGAGVGRGYLNQPELTARQFVRDRYSAKPGGRLYRTGDLVRHLHDGTLEIGGRVDQQIKVRGFRIEPAEIETVIRAHPEVRECAVLAIEDPAAAGTAATRRLMAFVVLQPTASTVDPGNQASGLREFLRRKLPDYMVPQRIVMLDRLPRTPSGKLHRVGLSSLVGPGTISEDAHSAAASRSAETLPRTPPRTPLEQSLARIWKTVLKVEQVFVDENFFDLGGNSLTCISVSIAARQAGLQVTLSQLYRHQTIADLAESIAAAPLDPESSGVRNIELGTAAPPPASPPPTASPRPRNVKEEGYRFSIDSLRAYGQEALVRAGLSPTGAEVVTEVQLEASLRDQVTHHMVSIPRYARRLMAGKINASPNIRVEGETDNSARIDGDNGPGQWISTVAMDVAIRKARQAGVGMVSVRRSNHFGAAGQYVWQATQQGMIGLCTTNGPLILAPTGGARPTFGNNPLGVGIPAMRHAPILVDIAMSVATRGKIGLTVAEGQPLAPGWILDKLGQPSVDLADLAAGLGVPIGGHKGYGLALIMEVLAGALSGSGFCADHEREKLHRPGHAPDFGHFFMAIDPARFMPPADFIARVDRMIDQIKSGPRVPGVEEIFVPGEMEMRARERNLRDGVPLSPATYRALVTYARDVGLSTRLEPVSTSVDPIGVVTIPC